MKETHANNFGFLRLSLAYAVIVSHSPEMLDGNRTREILVRLGSVYTLGGLAVDGFFLISGYLIASAYIRHPRVGDFLLNRVLRIYPAFIAASLVCLFIVGPLAGGDFGALHLAGWLKGAVRLVVLREPRLPGAFDMLPIASLSGSMWTILYEFRCYLLVAILGFTGLLNRRNWILGLTVILFLAAGCFEAIGFLPKGGLLARGLTALFGEPAILFPLTAIFMSGVCFRLFPEWQKFGKFAAIVCAIICAVAVLRVPLGDLSVGIFGAFVLFFAAMMVRSKLLGSINNRYDYSYGVYLYAWPVASLIILWMKNAGTALAPWELSTLTMVISTLVGAVSWYVLERPMLRLKHNRALSRVAH